MDLHIDHLDCQYFTARPLAESAWVQQRLDKIAQTVLTQVWGQWLSSAPMTDANQEALYFIDELAVQLSLDLAADNRTLAKDWARALHQGILRSLSQNKRGIVVFRNRCEFITTFLIDLSRGHAWGQWYYDEFEPLRSHPLNQIVRIVLTQDRDIGGDVLLSLTQQGALEIVLGCLSDADVDQIVHDCLLPPSVRVVPPRTYPVWVRELQRHLASHAQIASTHRARQVAQLYLTLLSRRPQLGPDVNLARFIQEILSWHQQLVGTGHLQRVLTLLSAGDIPTLLRQANAPVWLSQLFREVEGAEVARLLQSFTSAVPPPATQTAVVNRQFTAYGGVFLLIPTIMDLALSDYLQTCGYPEPDQGTTRSWLLFVLVLQCLGAAHVHRALADPTLAILAGLSMPSPRTRLAAYGDALTEDHHQTVYQTFQSHIDEQRRDPYLSTLLGDFPQIPSEHWSQLQLGDTVEINPQWDHTLSVMSGAILHLFAAKLGGFAGSSPDYLRRNIFTSQALVEQRPDEIHVTVLACPLQMVLRMVGFDNQSWTVPWWDEVSLTVEFK